MAMKLSYHRKFPKWILWIIIILLILGFAMSGRAASVSSSYSVYNGSLSSTYVDYLSSVMRDDLFSDYIIFRSDQYSYVLLVGDFDYSSGIFSGVADYGVLYSTSSSSYTSYYTVTQLDGGDVTVSNTGFYPVYSNLGTFAKVERGDLIGHVSEIIICLVPVYLLIRAGFSRIC